MSNFSKNFQDQLDLLNTTNSSATRDRANSSVDMEYFSSGHASTRSAAHRSFGWLNPDGFGAPFQPLQQLITL